MCLLDSRVRAYSALYCTGPQTPPQLPHVGLVRPETAVTAANESCPVPLLPSLLPLKCRPAENPTWMPGQSRMKLPFIQEVLLDPLTPPSWAPPTL